MKYIKFLLKKRGNILPPTDILLVTVTDVEAHAVIDIFKNETGQAYQKCFSGDKTYFDLGVLGGARIVMVQSEMGASGPGGTLLVVEEGIRILSPSAVIMVGIAFGVDEEKQSIGDILVSRQLLVYEPQKIATDGKNEMENIIRGDRTQASTRLLDRFRGGELNWCGKKVEFGLILSGDKLIDHQNFRDQLCKLAPEAIGGEMEGTGLYSAASRKKVDWIVVKAICDWADGNKKQDKSERQSKAAENAVNFIVHVFKQGGFVDHDKVPVWPIIKKPVGGQQNSPGQNGNNVIGTHLSSFPLRLIGISLLVIFVVIVIGGTILIPPLITPHSPGTISFTSVNDLNISCDSSNNNSTPTPGCDTGLILVKIDPTQSSTIWHFTLIQQGVEHKQVYLNPQLTDSNRNIYSPQGQKGPWSLSTGQSLSTIITFKVHPVSGIIYALSVSIHADTFITTYKTFSFTSGNTSSTSAKNSDTPPDASGALSSASNNVDIPCDSSRNNSTPTPGCDTGLMLVRIDPTQSSTIWHFMLIQRGVEHKQIIFWEMQLTDNNGYVYSSQGQAGPWSLSTGQSLSTIVTFKVHPVPGTIYALNVSIHADTFITIYKTIYFTSGNTSSTSVKNSDTPTSTPPRRFWNDTFYISKRL